MLTRLSQFEWTFSNTAEAATAVFLLVAVLAATLL